MGNMDGNVELSPDFDSCPKKSSFESHLEPIVNPMVKVFQPTIGFPSTFNPLRMQTHLRIPKAQTCLELRVQILWVSIVSTKTYSEHDKLNW